MMRQDVYKRQGEGKIIELGRNELELGYRTSVIAKKGYIVLGAVLKLERGDGEKIKTYMDELKEKRVTKQPLEYPSAGSTFKRPEGYFAGKLIEDAGLRGFQVGGAQVSEKHCGFVINRDHATAADIMELMRQVQTVSYTHLTTLASLTPLLLTTVAFALAAKAGAFNVGVEGEVFLGGIVAAYIGINWTFLPKPLLLIACFAGAIVVGAAWAFIPGILRCV